jgi:hypothetical protein
MMHRTVRLIYYAREGMLRGASGWEMFCRLKGAGYGILTRDAPEQALLLYWLYYHFNRHVGDWALDLDGTAPYHSPAGGAAAGPAGPLTPVLATLDADGKTMYLVLANASATRSVPCELALRNFPAATASGVTLSQPTLDADPLVKRAEDVVCPLPVGLEGGKAAFVLPAHAAAFVTLRLAGPSPSRPGP